MHRKSCIDCINAATRAISRKNVADICFTENNDLPTFWENKRFSILTALTIVTVAPEILIPYKIQEYRVDPKELKKILSHFMSLQIISMSDNEFLKPNAPISVQRRKYFGSHGI